VFIVHESLEFEFQNELVNHVMAFDDLFGDFLDCEEGIGLFMDCLVNCAELALAQGLANLEVADGDFTVELFALLGTGG
jgi:hypothetical protein